MSDATYARIVKLVECASEPVKTNLRKGNTCVGKEYKRLVNQERRQELIKAQLKASAELPEGFKLSLGDFREVCNELPESSIDMIFTDPPYDHENLPLYGDLAKLAQRVLKEGGSLITYVGHYAIPQILDYVAKSSNLKYIHVIAVLHDGASAALYAFHIRVKWKPLLWFVKGTNPNTFLYMEDVIQSQSPDKSSHDWAQSTVEAEHVISRLTVENQIILDPMMGSGTTGLGLLTLAENSLGLKLTKKGST